jgi:hypothetical protein
MKRFSLLPLIAVLILAPSLFASPRTPAKRYIEVRFLKLWDGHTDPTEVDLVLRGTLAGDRLDNVTITEFDSESQTSTVVLRKKTAKGETFNARKASRKNTYRYSLGQINWVENHFFTLYLPQKLPSADGFLKVEATMDGAEGSFVSYGSGRIQKARFGKAAPNKPIIAQTALKQRFVQYYATVEDGTGRVVYVDLPDQSSSYTEFRVLLGKPGEMVELEVERVIRYRDGGTTKVNAKSPEGESIYLYFPTKFHPDRKPTITEGSGPAVEMMLQPGDYQNLRVRLGIDGAKKNADIFDRSVDSDKKAKRVAGRNGEVKSDQEKQAEKNNRKAMSPDQRKAYDAGKYADGAVRDANSRALKK